MIKRSKTGYSDKWATPSKIYDPLHKEFNFNFDPCPITWKEGDPDGREIEWGSRTFCNPPYSIVADFVKKAHEEANKGKIVVMLINAAVDTKWFHKYINNKQEFRFPEGRITFINPAQPDKKCPSPRPSMIVVFRKTT